MGQLKLILFKITKGILQDSDPLVATTDTAYKLYNLKTLVIEQGTETALTNEKGNTLVTLIKYIKTEDSVFDDSESFIIEGTVIGCILCTTNTSVIFTYINSTTLSIIRLSGKDEDLNTIRCHILAKGNFNIKQDSNISGLFVYENSEILKIYWVDGINLLRHLNIQTTDIITDSIYLESKPSFKLEHTIKVTRLEGGGIFPAGVIQYAFTYFNKYGAETGIVDMTPLYYIGEVDRGREADTTIGCLYKVEISNPDTSFEFIRLYSILRTSYNGVPIVRIVKDIYIKDLNIL